MVSVHGAEKQANWQTDSYVDGQIQTGNKQQEQVTYMRVYAGMSPTGADHRKALIVLLSCPAL